MLKQHIHPASLQAGDEEVVAVQGISEKHITGVKNILEPAVERQLTASFARVRSHGRIQHRAGGQTHHPGEPHLWEAHPLRLTAGLRVPRLILFGVRHQDSGSVAKFYRPTSPAPAGASLTAKQFACFPRQRRNHLYRHAKARPAVSASARTRRRQTFGHALGDPAVDRSLARAILRQSLLQEHRQCHRRRILSLPVLRQQRLGLLQQLRARKSIEEIHRLEPLGPAADARLTLLGLKSGTTISQGWPRGWLGDCLVTTILPIPASLPHIYQRLTLHTLRAGAYVSAIALKRGQVFLGIILSESTSSQCVGCLF